ncbi:MAG: hypothetical protein ACOX1Q_03775 [Eubacteriales bacterium]
MAQLLFTPLYRLNPNNTKILDMEQVKEKLLSLAYIRDELARGVRRS